MDKSNLMEQILLSDNLNRAYLQVVRNKGADDCIIMVGSEMPAKRVMRNISRFIEEKLGLRST